MKNKITKFEKMTASQKRVAIAKDVLKQIKAKKTIIKTGVYHTFGDFGETFDKETFEIDKPKCTCCAVGAAIVSGVRLFNTFTLSYNGCDDCSSLKILSTWFSRQQVKLLEVAFESMSTRIMNAYDIPEKQYVAADAFYKAHASGGPMQRAIAIFKNIIKNKGTFKP